MLVWARTACVPVNERVMNRANLKVQRRAVRRRSLEVGCTLFWYDMFIPSSISVLHAGPKSLWLRRQLLLRSCLRVSLRRETRRQLLRSNCLRSHKLFGPACRTEIEEGINMSYQNNVQPTSRLRLRTARRWTLRFALFITLSLMGTQAVLAQTSMLQGTVSVSSTNGAGKRLPGASLRLTPASSGQPTRSGVTNEQGEYKFTDLAAGIYTLQIDLTGFKQQTKTVTLQKDTTAVENINLELG